MGMIKKIVTPEISINSILGEEASFKGVFMVKGPLRIDGNFTGKIISDGKVIIGKNGRAESLVIGRNVIVGGTVKGDIFAEDKVIVLKTGEVIGNIFACSVTMEDGVIFNGECKVVTKNVINELINFKKKEKYEF